MLLSWANRSQSHPREASANASAPSGCCWRHRTSSRHELDERLSLLAQHARSNGASHRLGVAPDVFLNLDARELRVRGEAVHLRTKEFGLMQALARHPGRTFTRRQLLDRAWGTDHDGDPRTVDVHVRWLREKLEALPDRPQRLVTVRGVGYRLVAPER